MFAFLCGEPQSVFAPSVFGFTYASLHQLAADLLSRPASRASLQLPSHPPRPPVLFGVRGLILAEDIEFKRSFNPQCNCFNFSHLVGCIKRGEEEHCIVRCKTISKAEVGPIDSSIKKSICTVLDIVPRRDCNHQVL